MIIMVIALFTPLVIATAVKMESKENTILSNVICMIALESESLIEDSSSGVVSASTF